MNPLKKLLGQTAVYGLSSIVGRMLNFLLVPFYLIVFDKNAAEYGVVSQVYAFTAFLMVFLTFGMETAYFRFIQSKPDKERVYNNSFLIVAGLNVFFFLLILFSSGNIADWLLLEDHGEYIFLMGVIVCVDAVTSLPLAKLRAEEKAKQFATIQFASIGVNILLNIVLLLSFYNPEEAGSGVYYILIANLISSLVKPAMLYKDFLTVRLNFDRKLAMEMLKYAFPMVLAGFAFIINETIDRVMLKQILSDLPGWTPKRADEEIGIYSACYKLAMLVSILLQAYRYAAEPFFFNQYKNQDRNKLYVKLMNYFVAIMCILFLGISLNIDIFRYFITSETYWAGLPVVPILLMANVFLGIYINQSIWYKLSDQTKFGAFIALGGATLTILINYLFIPSYGYYASAWATMIVYGAQMIASYLLGQKYFPIRYNLRKFFLYMGGCLGIFFFSRALHLETGSVIKFLVNNALILVFIGLVIFIEGIRFRKPKSA